MSDILVADWARYSCHCSNCKISLEDATYQQAKQFIQTHKTNGCCQFTDVMVIRII